MKQEIDITQKLHSKYERGLHSINIIFNYICMTTKFVPCNETDIKTALSICWQTHHNNHMKGLNDELISHCGSQVHPPRFNPSAIRATKEPLQRNCS